MKLLEKEFERSQRKGMWFLTNNIDLHSIEWAVYNVYKHQGSETAQYGLEIIFKYEFSAIGEPNRSRQSQISLIKYKFNFYLASSPVSSSSLLTLPIVDNAVHCMWKIILTLPCKQEEI